MTIRTTIAALCAISLALLPASGARSQSEDEVSASARALFQEGRTALMARKPEAARMAFERAYLLRPTPEIGYNLGLAEYETGRFVQAARHIAHYVRQNPNPTKDEIRALANAERFVSALVFDVNLQGVQVLVDDEDFGLTPFMFQPRYVLPGRHTIRATCQGFEDVEQIHDLDAGRRVDVKIVLDRKKPLSAQPPAPSTSNSAPAIAQPGPSPKEDASMARPFPARTVVLAGGVTLTVAAAVLAIVEGRMAASANSDLEDRRQQWGIGPSSCASMQNPGCASLADAANRHNDALQIMRPALIGAAILGTGTLAAWLFWPGSPRVRVTAQVLPTSAGLAISGDLQ